MHGRLGSGPSRNLKKAVAMNDDQIAASVREHTPELDPKDVIEFMREHAKPTASPVLHRMGGALASPAR